MQDHLRHFRTRAPISCGLMGLLLALFFLVSFQQDHGQGQTNSLIAREWGVAQDLMFVPQPGKKPLVLHGPFDVWDGDWWRIPLNAFHHGGMQPDTALLKLMISLAGIGWLGYFLERFFPKWFFLCWLAGAASITMLPEFLLPNTVQGATGIVCALLGVALALRKTDEELREKITDRFVIIVFLLLGLELVVRLSGNEAFASLSHFSGLLYGFLTGHVLRLSQNRAPRLILGSFLALHLALIPLFSLAMRPDWSGHYHWYQAVRAEQRRDDPEVIIAHLEAAVDRDPSLAQAWLMLAAWQHDEEQVAQAWRTILKGLNCNRSDENSAKLARIIWRRMQTPQDQLAALQTLQEVFGKEAPAWEERLEIIPNPEQPLGIVQLENPLIPPPEEADLKAPIVLSDGFHYSAAEEDYPAVAPEVDPEAPNSAAEGVLL